MILNAEKFAPAKKLPLLFRKRSALAITGAFLACPGIVVFGWLMAQPSEGLVNQNAPALVMVILQPGSMRAADPPQPLTVPRGGGDVKLELELADNSFHNYTSQLFRRSEALDMRDGLRMEAKGDHHGCFARPEKFYEMFSLKSHTHWSVVIGSLER